MNIYIESVMELLSIRKGEQFIIYWAAHTVEQVLTQSTFSRHKERLHYLSTKDKHQRTQLEWFHLLTGLSIRMKPISIFKFMPFNLVKNYFGEELHQRMFFRNWKINFFLHCFFISFCYLNLMLAQRWNKSNNLEN